jgi:autotransporter-associated beta strand protein
MLVIALVVVCTPRSAEASRYFWQNVNDGKWDNKDNWVDMDDPNNKDYPDGPGDEAHFTLAYTQPYTVTVPAAGVTVGAIYFDSHAITLAGATSGARLRIQTDAPAGGIILRLNPAPEGNSDTFDVRVDLLSDLNIHVENAPSNVVFNRPIDNVGAFHNVIKVGSGAVYMRGDNGYNGITNIVSGQLVLDTNPNEVIHGDIEIGSGVAGPGYVAELVVNAPHQIANQSRVWIKNQGRLQVNVSERVGNVILNDGFIYVGTVDGFLVPESITMTGGAIESAAGGIIRLDRGGITATSSATGPATIWRSSGGGTLNLDNTAVVFQVDDGPAAAHDLSIDLPISEIISRDVIKKGAGTLRYASGNTYTGQTVVQAGALWLEKGESIRGNLIIGNETQPALVDLRVSDAITNTARAYVGAQGALWINASEYLYSVETSLGTVLVGNKTNEASLSLVELVMTGGLVQMFHENTLEVGAVLSVSTFGTVPARIEGGNLALSNVGTFSVLGRDDVAIEARISSNIVAGGVKKLGVGVAVLSGNNTYAGATIIDQGGLVIDGQQPRSPIVINQGTLGGTGRTGLITAATATVAPGASPGRLSSGTVVFSPATTFDVELNGTAAAAYDQLAVTGTVTLSGARLQITAGAVLPADARWTIIDNDGADPIVGTFDALIEGAKLTIGGVEYAITYRGGDGNDVVIEAPEEEEPEPTYTYYLAEGATGSFFDDDVLIANPNEAQAPVTLTFLREGGATVVVQRTIPARSRVTIHVDQLEGLQDVSASVKVESTERLPLIVERSMFWDQSYYGGHTANAVSKPEKQWTFAEGSQGGFFDTYILIANANDSPTKVTFTFLRENETPVVKMVDVGPFARQTIHTGAYDELKERAFGIVVEATEPVIAERAMYFASQPNKTWAGGHVNTGTVAPSNSWFHAEGATGAYFKTFILLSNPQDTAAKIDVKFLLDTGQVIDRPKTLEPKQRVTINPATEDPLLANAAVSTVVRSDVPIVSERSMYWEGDVAGGLGEGHNSSGIPETGLRWGLAEGRNGGDRNFATYILLANPAAAKANVRITYLREGGAPIVKEYEVAATSRFNVDVKTVVPELQNSSFGAIIEVLNDVPIAVERSLYWDANGALWAGGTNALATRLPPIE